MDGEVPMSKTGTGNEVSRIHTVERDPNEAGIVSGVCRHCGCTEFTPCQVQTRTGEIGACAWIDEAHTICCAIDCIAKTPLNQLIEIFEAQQGRMPDANDPDVSRFA